MGNPFKTSKPPAPAPAPAPLPPPPARSDAETQQLAEENRRMFGGKKGRGAAYLTSTNGTTEPSTATRYLGG
jgi:hypothetical protein